MLTKKNLNNYPSELHTLQGIALKEKVLECWKIKEVASSSQKGILVEPDQKSKMEAKSERQTWATRRKTTKKNDNTNKESESVNMKLDSTFSDKYTEKL